jgi:hypothetical protein
MPSPHFERKAKEVLGDDAGQELGAVMDRVDPIRGDIAELKQTMLAMELRLTEKIGEKYAGLLKWSFVFWVGAVVAIAGLAGILKR